MSRFLLSLFILSLPLAAEAQFTPAPLPAPLRKFADAPRMRFGYIAVPENRANPSNTRTIQLAVVIVPALGATPQPDPVFYVVGGPGGSATLSSGGFPVFKELNKDRDIVYLDPRGAGFSEPNLFLRRDAASLRKFTSINRAYFQNQGIDLTGYNATEMAQDYESARVALGYGPINLFANSYGTFVAQEMLRRFPASLRAAVMSGNSPATDPFLPTTLPIEKHGVDALIRDVSSDRTARREFPNFRLHFYKLMASLYASPRKLKLKNLDTGKLESVTIDDQEFLSTLTELLQETGTIQYIPLLVRQFEQKNYHSLIARFFGPQKNLRLENPFGLYLSVLGIDFAAPGYVRATERGVLGTHDPTLIRADGLQIYQLAQTVVAWGLPYNPGTTRTLPQSTVRTLFLEGEMDAQTPVNGGAVIAAGVPNSVNYTYPRIGHGVGFSYGPDLTAAVSFIQTPALAPAFSFGSLHRRHFYKTRAPSFRTRGVDDWRDYLTDLPLSRALPRESAAGDDK